MEESNLTALDEMSSHIRRVVYPTEHELDAFALAIAVSHVSDAVTTLPRVLITGHRGQGKTTMFNLAERLSDETEDVTNSTAYAFKAVFNDHRDTAAPTLILDEVHTLFGPNGLRGATNEKRAVLCRGYEEGKTHLFASGQAAQRAYRAVKSKRGGLSVMQNPSLAGR